MPTVSELLARIDTRIPLTKAASWDPVGLQVGDPAAPVDKVGVCHEVTEEVVDAAADAGVDLLIAYHPLLFQPTTTLVAGRGPSGRAFRLARAGVALAVVHTAFDMARGGTADVLAEALGLDDIGGFGPEPPSPQVKVVTFVPDEAVEVVAAAMAAAGAGVIGNYRACSFRSQGMGAFLAGEGTSPVVGKVGEPNREPEMRLEMVAPAAIWPKVVAALVAAHPYEEPAYDVYEVKANMGFVGRVGFRRSSVAELADEVAKVCGAPPRMAGDPHRRVEKVAVVPGSGGSFLLGAAAVGAEVVVTGDVSHHRARESLDRGVAVLDPGHVATERPGVARLARLVADVVECDFVDLTGWDPSPWK